MKKDHVLSILITFTVGLIMGGYLYFTQFLPNFSPAAISETISLDMFTRDTLVIEGEKYGGFRVSTPPSFQINADGSFRFIPAAPRDSVAPVRTGMLPNELSRALERSMSQTALETASRERPREACESFVDGIDFRYQVERGDETYTLDTCGTAFSTSGDIGQALASVWEYFETLE
jgi:hypothetical protein